jgi:hypothetical protein
MIAQIIILLLVFGRLIIDFIDHGKINSRTINFWYTLMASVVSLGLYYLGGFFQWVF